MRRWTLAAAVGGMLVTLTQAPAAGVLRVDLNGAWQVAQQGHTEVLPATVPGCIHTDLMAAGRIPDPFFRDNEQKVQWVGESGWIYRRTFDVPAELLTREYVLLRCEGLDTLATIRVNGTQVATTDNMFRTYEFDVEKLLHTGANQIEVAFDSVLPVIRAKEAQRKLPTWAYPGAAYVRKEPCNFGWDWGPTLITCGIWRNIGLVGFDERLDKVQILQDHRADGTVELKISAGAFSIRIAAIRATVQLGNERVASATVATGCPPIIEIPLVIAKPKLWWPAGMGEQPLYIVTVEPLDADGSVLDTVTKRIGLRTLRTIEQTPDAPMHFVVNGVPFFAKGANWIPTDQFANRVTPAILRRYMEDAVAANMNTLRFWGGGYYEEDALYDLCDELGVCIWLDFKFGCTTYPAFDKDFLTNVQIEAEQQVQRLQHHPSIALWCGNNEIMFFRGKDAWTKDKMSAGDYYKLFRDVLGTSVKKFAPQTDFVTGSPDCGDVHFWEVWHGGKPFEVYRKIHGFVSEFGFQSFPDPKTVRAFTDPADRDSVYSYVMKYHERSNRMYLDVKEDGRIGTDKIMILVKKYFRDPKDFESTLWLSQITQAYGIQYGAEGWRREMPKSMGCVFWQYNDTWPCTSWASVDYFGRWKALQYAAKRFYAPVLVSATGDVKSQQVDLHVTSDRMADCRGQLTWTVTDLAGTQLAGDTLPVAIPARKSQKVRSISLADVLARHAPSDLLVWMNLQIDGRSMSQNLLTLAYPRELKLQDPELATTVTAQGDGFLVRITAAHPALWTWLDLPDADARYSDNFLHVAPHQPQEILVRPSKPMSDEAFRKALRVRSLWHLG